MVCGRYLIFGYLDPYGLRLGALAESALHAVPESAALLRGGQSHNASACTAGTNPAELRSLGLSV